MLDRVNAPLANHDYSSAALYRLPSVCSGRSHRARRAIRPL